MWTLQNVIVLGYSGLQIEQGVLSLKGVKAVEVEEDQLGILVTASYHDRVPPRHNAVFEVNIHAETQLTQVITGNKPFVRETPEHVSTRTCNFSRRKTLRSFC